MSGQVSLLQIVSTVMIALAVVNPVAAKTDWKAMSFEAFVEEHSDVKGKELAGQYRAAGVKMLTSMTGQGAYRSNRKDPVELYLQDFKQWCVAHDGVFATFPSKAISGGASPVPTDISRATNDLAKDIAAHFKKPRQIVSSFGYTLPLNSNNTEDLKLDAVRVAEETVHLASADEHRTFFSLTDIASANGKGREVYLPGVHSDIGGGYRDNALENLVIYLGFKHNAEADRLQHIDSGWYQNDEIRLELVSPRSPVPLVQLRVTRPGIRSQYNRIPLHLMVGYAKKKGIIFEAKLERVEEVPSELESAHSEIKAYVSQHDGLGTRTSKPEHWHDNHRGWLRELRHRYFHFSAHYSSPTVVGHIPRIEGGQRIRQVHRG